MTPPGGTHVSYRSATEVRSDFKQLLRSIVEEPGVRTVCDVGGGARPTLNPAFICERGLDYTVLDISPEELAKSSPVYKKVAADISGTLPDDLGTFDVVFSKTLAEHVHDAERFHRNVYALLNDGGVAVHLYPTLFAPAFVVNLVLPEAVSRWLLTRMQGAHRDAEGVHGKFPAFYRWCRGPSRRQLGRLRGIGYEVTEYRGYFGNPGYFGALHLGWLDDAVTRLLLRFPVPALTSFAIVVLRHPLVQREGVGATGAAASSADRAASA